MQGRLPFALDRSRSSITRSFSAKAVRIFTGSGFLVCTVAACLSGLNGQLM
jgi:hypothetical protein